jgi:parvulin-like peptidyl-prolyl isomerase
MNVGQRSQVVKSPFGFHIFEVTAKRAVKTQTLEEAKEKIKTILTQQKEQEVYATWLEEQVLKARVFKDDEFLKQIQVQTGGRR